MEGVLGPLESGRFIIENAKDVRILDEGVASLASILYEKVKTGTFNVKIWRQHELNPQSMDEDAVNWVFVSAVLNFSFWSHGEGSSNKFGVMYKGKLHSGYWALCAAINRALDEGIPITSPAFYASVSIDDMRNIFRSDTGVGMPLLEERTKVLNEAGKVLIMKFGSSFANVIKAAIKNAQSLLRIVLANFESFRDVADFAGKKVGIYKRAQILIGDLWGCCEGRGLGQFEDIDSITMFADYRIPQALVFFGVLGYSDDLMNKLKKDFQFQSGERLEVEIRGASIWACEMIRDRIHVLLKKDGLEQMYNINSVLIDHYLWDTRRERAKDMEDTPFHKCRDIYY